MLLCPLTSALCYVARATAAAAAEAIPDDAVASEWREGVTAGGGHFFHAPNRLAFAGAKMTFDKPMTDPERRR